MARPNIRSAIPAWLFAPEEISEYLERQEHTKFLAPQDPDLEMDDPDDEAEEEMEAWRQSKSRM